MLRRFGEFTSEFVSFAVFAFRCIRSIRLVGTSLKGAILRSKCDWYENGEKSTKFFLNLEKKRALNGTVKKLSDQKIKRYATAKKF